MGKVVLVTGVARRLGGRYVRRAMRDPDVDRVIGVDAVPPEHHLGGAEFVQADIRQPTIARVLAETGADTVVHMDVTGTPLGGGSRTTVKETNVIGTMQLLGACQKSPNVRRLVVKSSTNVYGSASRDPAVCVETTPPRSLPSGGLGGGALLRRVEQAARVAAEQALLVAAGRGGPAGPVAAGPAVLGGAVVAGAAGGAVRLLPGVSVVAVPESPGQHAVLVVLGGRFGEQGAQRGDVLLYGVEHRGHLLADVPELDRQPVAGGAPQVSRWEREKAERVRIGPREPGSRA
ncbi:hypothetical protein SFUMM280S_06048 [Streptomyces fumanus]